MPQKDKVAKVRAAQIEEIAKLKLPDLNCLDLESAKSSSPWDSFKYGPRVNLKKTKG